MWCTNVLRILQQVRGGVKVTDEFYKHTDKITTNEEVDKGI